MGKKKAQLSKDEILHLAKLANISLTEDEIKTYGKQLNDILSYIDQLSEVDTSSVKSTSNISGTENVLREDVVDDSRLLTDLSNLHIKEKDGKKYFIVSRIQ